VREVVATRPPPLRMLMNNPRPPTSPAAPTDLVVYRRQPDVAARDWASSTAASLRTLDRAERDETMLVPVRPVGRCERHPPSGPPG